MTRLHKSDLLALAILIGLSLAPHRGSLGLYGDDWTVLRAHALMGDGSVAGSFRAMYAWGFARMRPVQALYFALQYRAFGIEPLGYHLLNAAVFVAIGLLAYTVLRRLGVARRASVAVALVHAVLPHYSTDRAWYASSQAPLSVALYLAGLLLLFRALRGPPVAALLWLAASAVTTIASGLAYELALPLVLLHPLLAALALRAAAPDDVATATAHEGMRSLGRLIVHPRVLGAAMAGVVALTVLVAFKLPVTTRLAGGPKLPRLVAFSRQLAETNLWHYGLHSPVTVLRAAADSAPLAIAVSTLVALGAAWYLARLGRVERTRWPPPGTTLAIVAVAVAIIVLGQVAVVPGDCCMPTPFDRNNRVAIVGAFGVALSVVALAGAATARTAGAAGAKWFGAAIGLVVGAACVTSLQLTSWWVAAYRVELATLASVRAAFPTMPRGTTVLLDGDCAEVGPAFAFHSQYDLRSALGLQYRDTSLRGDVVTPSLAVRGDGVHTFKYGEDTRHPYERLVAFDRRRGVAHRLADSAAARAYFAAFNPSQAPGPCPSSARAR